jgi:hypothetical protein
MTWSDIVEAASAAARFASLAASRALYGRPGKGVAGSVSKFFVSYLVL